MTLGEKFGEVYIGRGTFEDECEKIADEFAIEFAEWFQNSYYSYNFEMKEVTFKELLEIYKKEQYGN